jgi:hypothetical protein
MRDKGKRLPWLIPSIKSSGMRIKTTFMKPSPSYNSLQSFASGRVFSAESRTFQETGRSSAEHGAML